ncbi:hypothetical protein C1H46_004259 [Malus baccata]|uniref:Uncharacterized protein n=1 Tax=Malus baccata TaxID=106549 RepID=A0A540NGE6_MALBA|nr:hypothetical protein C1H46_004259 [Malus baccata]
MAVCVILLQFFLGDYRPLARDEFGYLIDQETQLSTYRRNLQDPLCDSIFSHNHIN